MPRFLSVDDQGDTGDALQLGLAVLGIEADTAGHAAGATALAERHRFDAVICDVRMPDVDGITLGTRLGAMDPAMPLIFMTACEVAPADEEAPRTTAPRSSAGVRTRGGDGNAANRH